MTNSRSTLGALALAAALGLTVSPATAQEAQFSFDSPFFNQYNWRGINVVNGAVWQPSLDVAYGALSFNFWGNYELTGVSAYPGEGRFTELDSTLTYSGASGGADWSLGYIHYQFPSVGAAATSEVFATYSRPMGEWATTLAIYFDVDQADGVYLNLAFDQDLGVITSGGLSNEVSFSWGTAIGYGDKKHNLFYYGNSEANFADFSVYGAFTTSVSDSTDLYLTLLFSTLVDKDMLAGAPNRSNFVFGLGFSTGF
ncbi:MAG: hypothetical protein IH944_00955 [Armatimonadetes bacterium]|nr:hypothetical protein [Armatimonadota bacterium]